MCFLSRSVCTGEAEEAEEGGQAGQMGFWKNDGVKGDGAGSVEHVPDLAGPWRRNGVRVGGLALKLMLALGCPIKPRVGVYLHLLL